MADKTASFAINVDSNAAAVSTDAAAAMEQLRQKILASTDATKFMGSALRSLRGSSDEVVKAKVDLRARIEAERGSVSQATLSLLKMGTSYEKLTGDIRKTEAAQKRADAKKQADDLRRLAESTSKMEKGFRTAGGPLASLQDRLATLKGITTGTGGGMGALALGLGLVATAAAAVTVGIIHAGIELGKFLLSSADEVRTLGLVRESMTGSAQSGKALGTWVDFMAHRVSTARDKLTDLALQLDRTFSPSRTNVNPKKLGEVTQQAFYVASKAAAGMGKFGDEAAGKLTSIIERGKVFGRVRMSPEDLEGTGLKLTEIAEAYAKLNHLSIGDARAQLQGMGGDVLAVSQAMNVAADTRWGRTNAEQLLSLGAQWTRFKENLEKTGGSTVMEPLLKSLSKLLYKFDPASASGQKLQKAMERLGTAIVGMLDKIDLGDLVDDISGAIEGIASFAEWMEDISDSPWFSMMTTGFKVLGGVVLAAGAIIIGALALVGLAIGAIWKGFEWLGEKVYEAIDSFGKFTDWCWDLGTKIIAGLIDGLVKGATKVWDVITGIGDKIKSAFKKVLGISSPSSVFREFGKQTGAGYAEGLNASAGQVQAAADNLAPNAPPSDQRRTAGAAGAGAGGIAGAGQTIVVTFNIDATGQREGAAIAKAIKEESVQAQLLRTIRAALLTQGVPTQSAT